MNLLLHCGARRVEREQLESSPTPASHQNVGSRFRTIICLRKSKPSSLRTSFGSSIRPMRSLGQWADDTSDCSKSRTVR